MKNLLEQGKRYGVIYADPPWSYDDKMCREKGGVDTHYATQDLAWIKALPVGEIAAKDCALFMWAVSPLLPEALEVIQAWGFRFKTIAFCWSKISNRNATLFNMGRWTMGNIELCLLATRGKPKRIRRDVKQLVNGQRGMHSAKPAKVRVMIRELMGDVPRIELFARREPALFADASFEGWDVWGNESDGDGEGSR